MGATREGGLKAAATNRKRYGKDFYKKIGAKGGSWSDPSKRAFSKNRDLAREAGAKGGRISRKPKKV